MDEKGLEVSPPFDRPYMLGLASGNDEAGLAWTMGQVVLNGHAYIVDRKSGDYSRRSMRSVTMDRSDRTGENTASDNVWRRSFQSHHMGAGQVFTDRDFSNQYKFRDSRGINPWTEYALSLLHDVDRQSTHGGQCLVVDGRLAHVRGSIIDWWDDLSGSPAAVSLPADAVSITSDGANLYAALQTGAVVKAAPGQAPTQVVAGSYTVVGAVKGRLLACQGPTVYDITSGSAEVVWVHPEPGWRWASIGDGLTALYIAGHHGDKSALYRFRSKEDGTGIDVGIQAAQLPDGELARHVGYYLGFQVVGTDKGVRFGVSDSQGNLTLGRLVETPRAVLCSEGQGNHIWFGWSDVDGLQTGLGRLDPSRFTDPLTPAYATDLMADGQGQVLSVVTFKDRRVFTVSGLGLFTESDRLVEEGWLDEGITSWNTPDTKAGAFTSIRTAPLAGEVAVEVAADGEPFSQVGSMFRQGLTASEDFLLDGLLFSGVSVRLRLRRSADDPSSGPVVVRGELRAMPVAGRVSVFTVPLVISSTTEYQGSTMWYEAPAEVERLAGLVESGRLVVYREGVRAWRVVATEYEWKPEKMTAQEAGWSGVFTIQLTEVA